MGAKLVRIAVPAAARIGTVLTEKIIIKDAFVHTQLLPEADHEVDLDTDFLPLLF